MIKEKLKNILTKIKNNKKKVVGITIGVFVVFIFTFTVYNLNNPTKFNRLFANVLNNGVPANSNFEDNTFYSCVVDAYNSDNGTSRAYTDDLTDEELASVTSLMCEGWNYSDSDKITSAKGVEKLTGLTTLDLYGNKLTNIDLSSNVSLISLSLGSNQLTSIDLSQNISLKSVELNGNDLSNIDLSHNILLEQLDLDENKLTSIDLSQNNLLWSLHLLGNQLKNLNLSNNTYIKSLDVAGNRLTEINLKQNVKLERLNLAVNDLTTIDLGENTSLAELGLYYNQLTSIDLSKNTELEYLGLSGNQLLTSLDLSGNTSLRSLDIDATKLKEDILMQAGETYNIEEKIVPPEGQGFTYSIDNTSIATIEGNTITAQSEGSTTLKATFGNVSFDRKLAVGKVVLSSKDNYVTINDEEKYVYTIDGDIKDLSTNVGTIVRDKDQIKVMLNDKVLVEYKLAYIENTIRGYDDNYLIMYSSTDNLNYNNAINCTYDLSKDGKEMSIKYNGKEIDTKNLIYVYLPFYFKTTTRGIAASDNIKITNFKDRINIINNKSEINKDKINVLNATSVEWDDSGDVYAFIIKVDSEEISDLLINYSIHSDNYDLSKEYIYLGTNDFVNDIIIKIDYELCVLNIRNNNNILAVSDEEENNFTFFWDLIKVTSDKYDMGSDTINLGNEDIDLTKINVTNATLKKVDNNKLLVMYGDEVVKEFKLEGGKETTTTTKKDDEKITTTTKDKTTTKEEVKTTTTKKKVSIIDKIFGNTETTTVKKEETTTKKNIFRKSTTTKVENNSGNVTSNNKNSFKKLVTGSNLLILLLSVIDIALIIYIIVDKKKNKET